jgi:hypothetical protein
MMKLLERMRPVIAFCECRARLIKGADAIRPRDFSWAGPVPTGETGDRTNTGGKGAHVIEQGQGDEMVDPPVIIAPLQVRMGML